MSCNNITVDTINFKGDIIPLRWYHEIKQKTGYADLNSIHLLAHIVYYYRPTSIFKNGKLDCYKKKFKRDYLQKSYSDLAISIGISVDQVRDSLKKLEELKLITREYRNLKICGKNLNNLMFIRIHPENILKISDQSKNNELDPIIIAKSQLPDEVMQISKINFSGNIIPRRWLSEIRQDNGKVDLISITLLADLVYWNRSIKGEGIQNKFSKESLQKDFRDLSDKFSLYTPSIKTAISRLEKQGLITVHFKDITTHGRVIKKVQFIDVRSENVLKISEVNTESQEINEISTLADGFSEDTKRNFLRYPTEFLNTNTKITTKDFTKTTQISLAEINPKILNSELESNLKEKEINVENKNNQIKENQDRVGDCIIIQAFDIWRSKVWKNDLILTKNRQKALKSLFDNLLQNDIKQWELLCQKVIESDFLAGKIKQFKATIDWILKEQNAIKVLEGNYDNIIKLEKPNSSSPEWIRYMMTELKKPKGSNILSLTEIFLPLQDVYKEDELLKAVNFFKEKKGFVPTLVQFEEVLENNRYLVKLAVNDKLFAAKISEEKCEIKKEFLSNTQSLCNPILLKYFDQIRISVKEKQTTTENLKNFESIYVFDVPAPLTEEVGWGSSEQGWEPVQDAFKYFAHRLKGMNYIIQEKYLEEDIFHGFEENNKHLASDDVLEKFNTSFLMSTLVEFMTDDREYTKDKIKEYVASRLQYFKRTYGCETYNKAFKFFVSENRCPSLKEFEEFFEEVKSAA